MKIAQIVCSFPPYPGGIGQSAWRLGEMLSQEHEVKTFTLKNSDNLESKTNLKFKQKVHYLDPFIRLGHGALNFSLLFKLKKFDCLYLHYPFFGTAELIRLWLSFYPQKKLVIHYHMDTPKLQGFKKILSLSSLAVENSLFKKADKIIVSSLDYAQAGSFDKYYKQFPNKITELPFGVDIEVFKPKMKENSHHPYFQQAQDLVKKITQKIINRNKTQILFVGGLDQAHYFKGLDILLQALAKLKNYAWNLNIIGDGELKESYFETAEKLDIAENVKFKGRVSEEDLIDYYQKSSFLVLPSINSHEAFGLVLIEALACGLPVIASHLPGVRKVFSHKQEGLQVKAKSTDDLKNKIEFLFNKPDILNNMSLKARQLATKKYDNSKIADILLDEFSKL
jgi:glycosyltransferase involved in cell wall biosynthesis